MKCLSEIIEPDLFIKKYIFFQNLLKIINQTKDLSWFFSFIFNILENCL